MKKLLLLLLLCPALGYSQSFGDDFMDWVKNKANKQSKDYTTAHWKLFWNNYHILVHEAASTKLQQIDSVMKVFTHFNDSIVKRFDTANLGQYVTLKKSYNDQLAILYSLSGEIEALSGKLNTQAASYDDFISSGYHHFGTTTLLESYSKLSNNSSNIETSYGVSYSQSINSDGSAAGTGEIRPTSSAFDTKNDIEAAVVGVGSYMMQIPELEVYGMAILSVYSGYKLYEHQEFLKQVKILEKAFKLLPEKMLKPKETYDIYISAFNESKARYDSLRMVRQTALKSFDTLSKSLLEFNFEMVSMCNKILTSEKVSVLSNSYSQNPKPYEHLFNHQLVLKGINDVYNFAKEVRQLKLAEIQETTAAKKLARNEEVQDALMEYTAITKFLLSKAEFAPVYTEFNEVLENFRHLEATQKIYSRQLISRLNKTQKKFESYQPAKSSKPSEPGLVQSDVPVSKKNKEAHFSFDPGEYVYLNLQGNFGSGNFYLTGGFAVAPYNRHFQGSSTSSTTEHSPFDGGYNYDNRDPSVETDKMKNNIEKRIHDMNYASGKIDQLSTAWTQANLRATIGEIGKIQTYNTMLKESIYRNQTVNGVQVTAYEAKVKEFSKMPLSAARLQQFYTDNGVTTTVLSQVPAKNIRPNGYSSPLVNNRTAVYKNAGEIDKEVIYETNKTASAFDVVWNRYKKHESNHSKDPVFGSETDLRNTISLSQSFLLAASKITETTNAFYRNDPRLAKATALSFIENARILRFYSLGFLPEYALTSNHFYLDYERLRGTLKTNANEYYSFCDPNLSLEQSDCNKFTSYYLKDIYGIGDFYNNPEGKDQVIRDGSKIPVLNSTQISSQASKDWLKLGDAGDQLTLNLAGLYAGMGFAVIAVKPGHVCIILPTDPQKYFRSGSWNLNVPNILNYAQVNYLDNLNIQLDVPLSKAWSSPNGVMIYIKPQLKDY